MFKDISSNHGPHEIALSASHTIGLESAGQVCTFLYFFEVSHSVPLTVQDGHMKLCSYRAKP